VWGKPPRGFEPRTDGLRNRAGAVRRLAEYSHDMSGFKVPDPVLAASEDQRGKASQSDPDANRAVMMQVPEVGPLLRALLPVHLSGGYTLTFGLWLLVRPDDLQRAFRVWWSPEYVLFKVGG